MKKPIYMMCAALGALLLAGCSLDVVNKANIEAEDYLSGEEGVEALRVYVYSSIKPLVNETDLTEWGTDLYTNTRSTAVNDFQSYKFSSEESSVSNYYKNAYAMINQANALLKFGSGNAQYEAEAKFIRCLGYYWLTQQFGAVPYVTEYIANANTNYPRKPVKEVYDLVIAELESIKDDAALPEESHTGLVSRRAVNALLAKLCLAAGWDVETELVDAQKGTFTIKGTTYFQKALQYADSTIDGQHLTMSFADKWSPYNEGNEEEIFSVQYERNGYPGDELTGGNSRQSAYGAALGDPAVEGLKSGTGGLATSWKSLYLWDEGDDRYDGTFMTTIYNYTPGEWGTTGYYAYYRNPSGLDQLNIADRFFPWYVSRDSVERFLAAHQSQFEQRSSSAICHALLLTYPDASIWDFNLDGSVSDVKTNDFEYFKRTYNPGLTTVRKFDDPNSPQIKSGSFCYRDIVVLHLSDVYLMAAEAAYMAGQEGKAFQYLNEVRTRSHAQALNSLADYTAPYAQFAHENFGEVNMIDLILDERGRELYAETCRWADLRRTRQLVRYCVAFCDGVTSVEDMSNVNGEIKWLRPIPAAELATNTAISEADQNPGY